LRRDLERRCIGDHGSQNLAIVSSDRLCFSRPWAGVPTGLLISLQDLEDNARDNLSSLAEKAGLSLEQCHVVVGPVATRVVEHAVDVGADLILVGGHGRHGFKKLLGSTANAVLNRATVDVLVVRLGE